MKGRGGRLPPKRDVRRDIEEEIRFHIEGAVEDLVAEGLPEDEARRQVLAEFGDVAGVRARCREIAEDRLRRERREDVMESFVRDVGLAGRRLRREPGFAAAAVLTLALGIGATVAMFSVVQSVVLRPLPYPDSHRLVRVWPGANFNIAMVEYFRDARTLEAMTGLSRWSFNLTGVGDPAQVDGIAVDPEYFEVFGIRPALGRAFLPEERYYDRAGVALLGWRFWQSRFGGDPEVLGRRISLDGHKEGTREIIGVMPEGHQPPGTPVDVWVPLSTASAGYTVAQDSSWYVNDVVARLSPGATAEQARNEVRDLARRLREDFPGRFREDYVQTADAASLLDDTVGEVRGALWVMLGSVGLVLVIACGNVANLLLARMADRTRDLALRSALGASRWRLARQSLAESLLLAVLGGAMGLLLAWWGVGVSSAGVALALPRGAEVSMSLPVLLFAGGLTGLSVLFFGLLPATRGSGGNVAGELRASRRGSSESRVHRRLRKGLIFLEVALAMMLVAGAGLLLRSFWSLYRTDPGFRAEGAVVIQVAGPGGEQPDRRSALSQYYERVRRHLAATPGVESVGGIQLLPLAGGNWSFPYLAEGHSPGPDGNLSSANFRVVTPGYFRTMGIPLLQGRTLRESDRGEPPVGLVNRAMAEDLWPGEDPVGKTIKLFGSQEFTVVGVVGDVRQFSLDREPLPEMYQPLSQFAAGSLFVVVRGSGPDVTALAPALKERIWEVDPDVPIPYVGTLNEVMGDSVARSRFFAAVLAGFGVLALILGAVGVYGVMAYAVATRLREFGVRLALGAAPGSVVRRAMGDALLPVGGGLLVGVGGALAAGRVLSSLLYRVSPGDPVTLAAVATVLAGVAAAAVFIPARRASRVDPVRVLNAE